MTHMNQYNRILSACAKLGEFHFAQLLLEGMRVQELSPNSDTLTALALLHSKKPKRESLLSGVPAFKDHPKVIVKAILNAERHRTKNANSRREAHAAHRWLVQQPAALVKAKTNLFKLTAAVAAGCKLSRKQASGALGVLRGNKTLYVSKGEAGKKRWHIKNYHGPLHSIKKK